MGTPAERRALGALTALVTLGAGVQAAQARKVERSPLAAVEQPPLERQLAAVDSARFRQGHRNRALAGRAAADGQRRQAGESRPVGAMPGAPLASTAERRPVAKPVDLERASATELEALPGIGPALAKRIVEDRVARGPFGSMTGLRRVRGVGPALARKLADCVTFAGVAPT